MHPFEDLIVPAGAIGIHWFGQSSYALKNADGAILQVDPYFPRQRPPDRFIHRRPPLDEGTLRTDGVLLTHDHGDHTCLESLQRIHAAFPAAVYMGPRESMAALAQAGLSPLQEIAAGEAAELAGDRIHAVLAKPPEGVAEEGIDPPDVTHLGYVIQSPEVSVYLSGDPINTFAEHEELLAPIRALQPDIGLLTTHPQEGEFPFFPGSARMARELGLKTAVPAHYDCFVKRTYDPREWATHLVGVTPLIIPYNQAVVYRP